jgi:uncharacterized protein
MADDIEVVYSPLQQRFSSKGHTVEIQIYKGANEARWILEVVDAGGTSTVWDEPFSTDQDALDEALNAFEEEGIVSFLTDAPRGLHLVE